MGLLLMNYIAAMHNLFLKHCCFVWGLLLPRNTLFHYFPRGPDLSVVEDFTISLFSHEMQPKFFFLLTQSHFSNLKSLLLYIILAASVAWVIVTFITPYSPPVHHQPKCFWSFLPGFLFVWDFFGVGWGFREEGVVLLFYPNLTSLWELCDSFPIYISYLPRLQQMTGQRDLGGMLGLPAGAITPLQGGLWLPLKDTKPRAKASSEVCTTCQPER